MPFLPCLLALVSIAAADAASADAGDGRPLRVVASGALDALDAELLATFAKTHGRRLLTVTGGPSAVTAGDADVAAGLFAEDATPPALEATAEVFPSRLVAVSRRPGPPAASIESLRWARIGVLRGSRAPAAVHDAKVSGAEITEYRGLEAAVSALRAGTVAFLLVELPEALLGLRGDARLELGVFLGARRSRVYAVRGQDRDLRAALNGYLQGLRRTPSWAVLVSRHYGPAAFEALARAHLAD